MSYHKFYPFCLTVESGDYRVVHYQPNEAKNELDVFVVLEQAYLHPGVGYGSTLVQVDLPGYVELTTRPLAILHPHRPVRTIFGGCTFSGPAGFQSIGAGKVSITGIIRYLLFLFNLTL